MTVRIDSAAPSLSTLPDPAAAPKPPALPAQRPLYGYEGRTPERHAEAHAANVAIREQDVLEFGRYVDAFVAAHARCRTLAEADAFGPLQALPGGGVPVGATGDERVEIAHVDERANSLAKRGGAEIAAHLARLRGEKTPFTSDASGAVSAYVSAGNGRRYGVAAGASTDGPITADAFVGSQRHRATLSGTPGAAAPPAREYALGPVTVTLRDGHRDRLEIDPAPLSPFGLTVATDKQSVTLCGRAGKTFKKDDEDRAITLEAKLCGTVHLTTADTFDAGVGAMLRRPESASHE